jgi:hypothetical protein
MWMRRRNLVRLAIAAGALTLSACDVPTALPRWDTAWAVPVDALEMGVASLLPSGVKLTPDGKAFELNVDGLRLMEPLGALCADCWALEGQTAPKPPFLAVLRADVTVPADVVAASIVGGEARLDLFHNFGFDPVRPNAARRGSIRVVMTSRGDTLAAGSIDGTTEAFPSGTHKALAIPFRNGELRDSVKLSVIIDSPEGDPVRIDNASHFDLTLSPSPIRISEARVKVDAHAVTMKETSFEIVGGDALVNRIRNGTLTLDIDNPFQVAGSFSFALSAPGISAVRKVALQPGKATSRLEFTGQELQAILKGEKAALSATGTVSASGGTVAIRPDQILKAKSRFELTIATTEK